MLLETKQVDPFDIPPHLVPPGMSYQWCSKKVMGLIDPAYRRYLDAGWCAVPPKRHADFFPSSYTNPVGEIEYGGCVLLERNLTKTDLAREREIDAACLNARNGRTVAIDLVVRVRLSHEELDAAKTCDQTSSQYSSRRIQLMAEGCDNDLCLYGWDGALLFGKKKHVPRLVPRFAVLKWLFNLISKETQE